MKNQKGITLIALIITIIVMLILTGIAISTLVSEEGVLTKAEDVGLIQTVAAIQEKLKLAVSANKIDDLVGTGKNYTLEEIFNGTGKITTYSKYREFIEYFNDEYLKTYYETDIDFLKFGNLYSFSGEIIGEDLIWLATEIVTGEEFAHSNFEEIIELEKINASTELGKTGTSKLIFDGEITAFISKKDMFFIDEDYNVYYMANNGDIVTSNGILKAEEITISDPNEYTSAEKQAYLGIYKALEEFTGDSAYARMVVENDLNPNTLLNSFYTGGYLPIELKQGDKVIKQNLAALMINPGEEYSFQDAILKEPVYLVEYDNGKYTMYNLVENKTKKTKELYDENGKLLYDNITSEVSNTGIIEEYNGYTFMKRFDGRDAIIVGLPDQERVDIKTDSVDFKYNIKYWNNGINTKIVKELILPDSIENMEMLAYTREMSGSAAIGDFTGMPNLEKIELPANVKILYGNAFDELRNLKEVVMPDNIETISSTAFKGLTQDITVRFPGGKEVSGKPWGAEGNITVITENN